MKLRSRKPMTQIKSKYLMEKSKKKSDEPNAILVLWRLLPKKYHAKTYIVVLLTLVGAVLETIGIGLVIPAVGLMVDTSLGDKHTFLIPLLAALGNLSQVHLAIFGMLLLLCTFVVKNLFLAFLSWQQMQYAYGVKAYLSARLFEKYVCSPYEFHLRQNSGPLIRNLVTEVQKFTGYALLPAILLTAEVAVLFLISILLLVVEPIGSMLLFGVVASAMYAFQLKTKKYLKKWGTESQMSEGYRIQKAQEGLAGIKDVKLLGKEVEFIDEYKVHNFNASMTDCKNQTLSQFPRLWLETVGVLGFTLLVIVSVQEKNTTVDLIPTIALFGVAAFRILPSANRILGALQNLGYARVVLELMSKELEANNEIAETKNNPLRLGGEIRLHNVSYAYPDAFTETISDICLTIKKGQSVGLVGPSGAGKTTLVDVILGLLRPTSGAIYIDDIDMNEGMRSWQNLIGYVQQSIFLTDDTLRRNIAFGLKDEEINENLVQQAVEAAQLKRVVDALPEGVNTFVGERGVRFSGGQRQRIGIARALYHNPPVLVFDEATSALDKETEVEVLEEIKMLKGARTMIFIAHNLSTLEHCDRIFQIKNGGLHEEMQSPFH